MDSIWTERVMQLVTFVLDSVDHLSPGEPNGISETGKTLYKMLDNLSVSPVESGVVNFTSHNSQPPQASPPLGSAYPPLDPCAGSETRPGVAQEQIVLQDTETTQAFFSDSDIGSVIYDKSTSHDVDSCASPTSTLCSDSDAFLGCSPPNGNTGVKTQVELESGSAMIGSFPGPVGGHGAFEDTSDGIRRLDSGMAPPLPYDVFNSITDPNSWCGGYNGDSLGDIVYPGSNGMFHCSSLSLSLAEWLHLGVSSIPDVPPSAATFVEKQLNNHIDVSAGSDSYAPSVLPEPAEYFPLFGQSSLSPIFLNDQCFPVNNYVQATGPQLLPYQVYSYQQAYIPVSMVLPPALVPNPHSQSIGFPAQGCGDALFVSVAGPPLPGAGIACTPFRSSVGINANATERPRKSKAGPKRPARRKARVSASGAPYVVKNPLRCVLPDCTIPEWNFASNRELKRHQESAVEHSTFRPVCLECGRDYSRHDAVVRHAKLRHPRNDDSQVKSL